ncbi:MAG: hypothetical protein AAF696_21500 [Bacteroidota bacterium]
MEKEIKEAYANLETNPLTWSVPLVNYLENIERHRSMYWAIGGLRYISLESSFDNELKSKYLSWLEMLKEIVERKKAYSIEEISNISEVIFNYPPNRNVLQAAISRAFDAEATLLSGKYEIFKKKIAYSLNSLRNTEDSNKTITKLIEIFPDFV